MPTIELCYHIAKRESWRGTDGITIKSNLADDKSIECDLSESLIKQLKEGSASLDADKLLLSIAEAQKRAIKTSYQEMDDMALQAKVNADKTHEALLKISLDAETKYEELEKVFSSTEKRFQKYIQETTKEIDQSINQLNTLISALSNINDYSLTRITDTLTQLIKLAESDPEILKLVLQYKNEKVAE